MVTKAVNMNAFYEEVKKIHETTANVLGSRVGDMYHQSQIIQFSEKIAIAFCKWRRQREFEINTLNQRNHDDKELFEFFIQEYGQMLNGQ